MKNHPCWFRSVRRDWGGNILGAGFWVEGTPRDSFRNALCFKGVGWVSRLGLASSSEWGLMKTNDLTRSKGWDQGRRIPRPSQFPTWEINEGREQPFLCIIYSPRPQSPAVVVCSPPVGLLRPHDAQSRALLLTMAVHSADNSMLNPVPLLAVLWCSNETFNVWLFTHLRKTEQHFFFYTALTNHTTVVIAVFAMWYECAS